VPGEGCPSPGLLAILLARATVVPMGQRYREVKTRGERSWPTVISPPRAAQEANMGRRNALTVATTGRRLGRHRIPR